MSCELIPVSMALSDQEYSYSPPHPLDEMLMRRRATPGIKFFIRREVFTSSPHHVFRTMCMFSLFKFLYNSKQYFLPLQMQNLESLIVL